MFFESVFDKIESWANKKASININTPILGLCRSLLACATLITLVFNDYAVLFPEIQGIQSILPEQDFFLNKISIFTLMGGNYLLAKYISIFILLVAIVGWRPRVSAVFHWWITFSLFSSSPSIDGGDQLASILTLLLIPICLSDTRKSHWNHQKSKRPELSRYGFFVYTVLAVIRIQVSFVYFQAATHKFNVNEWMDGTVLYYWFNHPYFGLNKNLIWISDLLFSSYVTTSILTWSILVLELLLFMGLLSDKKYRTPLFWAGFTFHFFTWTIHGLFSFFLVMTSALILYLLPLDNSTLIDNLSIKKRLGNVLKS